jgi:serine/threonine protein kinase
VFLAGFMLLILDIARFFGRGKMLLAGQQIGKYRIVRSLGSGRVYLAMDIHLDRQVIMNVIEVEMPSDTDNQAILELRRLVKPELDKLEELSHPSIISVYDSDVERINGTILIYIVTPFYKEGSLNDWLQSRSDADLLSPQICAHIVGQIAQALYYAHTQQVLHRQLTLEKLLIRQKPEPHNAPDLWLTGFMPYSPHQATSGDPFYMAPEQWTGSATTATDQYSLAVIAYSLLTGDFPFHGTQEQVKEQHLHAQPQPPSKRIASLPPLLDIVLLKALAKQPEARFVSVSAFAAAFTDAAQSQHSFWSTLVINEQDVQRGVIRTVTRPEGERIDLAIPADSYDGQIIRLRGQGASAGDLFIVISVREVPADSPVLDGELPDVTTRPLPPEEDGDKTIRREISRLVDEGFATVPARSSPISVSNKRRAEFPTLPAFVKNTSNAVTSWFVSPPPAGAPPLQSPQRNLPGIKNILMLVLASFIIISAGSLCYVGGVNQAVAADVQASATAQIHTVSTAFSSTVVAQTSATATASYDPYPPVQGTLAFADALRANGKDNPWQEIGTGCIFIDGSYQVSRSDQGVNTCTRYGDVPSNFTYQVQMTVTQGDAGGITFRYDGTNDTCYYFAISTNGYYALFYVHNDNYIPILNWTSSAAINTGAGPTNLLAVVVRGRAVDLYVNNQHLAGITDAAVVTGQIGVAAENAESNTEVTFSDVKVWKI